MCCWWYKIRIISGRFKGKRLAVPKDYSIRPTQDRVKESIFNVLGKDISGKSVLDLFAGSGSLGLEALSRGCKQVYFVDDNRKAIKLISENIDLLGLSREFYKIIKGDAISVIKNRDIPDFDYVFLDPPYNISRLIMTEIFKTLENNNIIGEGSLVIYEYFFKRDIDDEIRGLVSIKESFFGDKIVNYLKLKEPNGQNRNMPWHL